MLCIQHFHAKGYIHVNKQRIWTVLREDMACTKQLCEHPVLIQLRVGGKMLRMTQPYEIWVNNEFRLSL